MTGPAPQPSLDPQDAEKIRALTHAVAGAAADILLPILGEHLKHAAERIESGLDTLADAVNAIDLREAVPPPAPHSAFLLLHVRNGHGPDGKLIHTELRLEASEIVQYHPDPRRSSGGTSSILELRTKDENGAPTLLRTEETVEQLDDMLALCGSALIRADA